MNRRTEPRFDVYYRAKITPIDHPQTEIDAFLTDISGGGMRLVADRELPEDQMICVEVGQHLVLADVRRSVPRGNRFVVGAEKVHTLNLLTLPEDMDRQEQIQALVDDYHLRIQFELGSSKSKEDPATPDRLARPLEYLAPIDEMVPERSAVTVPTPARAPEAPPTPEPVAAAVEAPPALPSEPIIETTVETTAEAVTARVPDPEPPPMPQEPHLAPAIPANPVAAAAPPIPVTVPVEVDFGQLGVMFPPTHGLQPLEPEAAVNVPEIPVADAANAEIEVADATHVEPPAAHHAPSEAPLRGTEWVPELPRQESEWDALRAIAYQYQSAPEPEPPARSSSRTRIAAMVAAVLSAAALMAMFFGPVRKSALFLPPLTSAAAKTSSRAPQEPRKELIVHVDSVVPPEPSVVQAESKPMPAPVAAKPAAAVSPATIPAAIPAASPATGAGRVHGASIRTTAESWIAACADGKSLAGKLLPSGGNFEIEFSRQASILVGNAGGVEISLEGKPLGELGPSGKSRMVELTPSGFHILTAGNIDDCAKP